MPTKYSPNTLISLFQFGGKQVYGSYFTYKNTMGAMNASKNNTNTSVLIGGEANFGCIVRNMQTAQHAVIIEINIYR